MPSVPSSPTSSLFAQIAGLTGSGRLAFLHSLSQHARLLTIDTSLPAGALIVERFKGREAMSQLFRFDVDCLATSAHYELKALTGEEVTLRLMLADGGTRSFHGIVTRADQLGADGSLTRYRLTLSPWMHSLTLRRDCYVFQDKTVLEILEDVLNDYPTANYRFDVNTSLPKRSMTIQYRESDYDFITRLLAEEGLSFFFRHDDHARGPASPGSRDRSEQPGSPSVQARHQFVVFDDHSTLAASAQSAIRFHRAAATEATDTITLFARRRQVQPNNVVLTSWDYKKLAATSVEEATPTDAENVPLLEIHEGAGAYRYTDEQEAARIAQARAESLELANQRTDAESSVRALAVGTWFELTNHPDISSITDGPRADREFTVLSIEHRGANNLSAGMTELAAHDAVEPGTYRNHFTCVPRTVPIRPTYWFPKPTAPGSQVALVVGIASEEITTERDHRVKVQFPWQRGEQPASGQLDHPTTPNAPGDQRAGTWVRVAEPSAGANWGASFMPRIGQEVLIRFVADDIDRPVVVGQFYNGADTPPFHGADNHPGALAGVKTKEYANSGFNQWVIDDTSGQLRQSVASTYAASQLNLGYLIRQNGNVRGAYRGNGFELATDAWNALRAKRGMFVSTTQRSDAVSTQLDTQEAQSKLKAADELSTALSDAAHQHQALPLATPQGLQQLIKTVSGNHTADGGAAPVFDTPITLLDSAAGINATTPASMVMLAGQDLTMTAASAMRVTGGQAVSLAVAKAASLFTHAGGAKVIAGNSPVSVRAHTGPMDVIADQAMTVTSSNASIKVQAKQEILLTSGGGYVRLAGSNIDIHCPSAVSVKGVTHDFLGAASMTPNLPFLPNALAKIKNWIAVNYRDL